MTDQITPDSRPTAGPSLKRGHGFRIFYIPEPPDSRPTAGPSLKQARVAG